MKIIFTGDIHNHPAFMKKGMLEEFAQDVANEEPDLIILGGDIGEALTNTELVREVFQTFQRQGCHAGAFFLGNHDLWCEPPNSSLDLWTKILPDIGEEEGWHYLEQRNWIKDGVAVVGSYLHYDYSAKDIGGIVEAHIHASFPNWTPDEYYERMKKAVNNDAKFLNGLPRDIDFAQQVGEGFQKRLLAAESDPEVHTIIVATHVPCMPSQVTRKPSDYRWSMATPYFGNLSHVEPIMSCSKVKYVFSCHSHQDNETTVEFNDGHKVDVINLGADYGQPEFGLIEV